MSTPRPADASGILLTTADRQFESLLEGASASDVFEDSLFESLLFHRRVVVPDIFAFISSSIAQPHLKSTLTSFEAALRSDLVVPAFRGDARSFGAALERVRDQRIAGLRDNVDALATKLDKIRSASKFEDVQMNWPADMSRTYGQRLLRTFRAVVATTLEGGRVHKELELTARFIARYRLVDRIESEIDDAGGELKRGFVLQALLDSLNEVQDCGTDEFKDARVLLAHPAARQDAGARIAVRNLVCLANFSYHRNMAGSLGTNTYLPGRAYPVEVHAMADFEVAQHLAPEADEPSPAPALYEFQVRMPSLAQLRTVGVERLLALREQYGLGYFSQLETWQLGKATQESVALSLGEYAASLCAEIRSEAPMMNVVLRRQSKTERAGVQGLSDALSTAAKAHAVPHATGIAAVLALVGKPANILYQWGAASNRTIRHAAVANVVV